MVIVPTQDNVIIKLPKQEKEKTTTSGIIVATANTQQEMPEQGEVVAVGKGRYLNSGELIPSEVKVGDTIIFNKFAGTKISSENEEFLIVRENDILAIVK